MALLDSFDTPPLSRNMSDCALVSGAWYLGGLICCSCLHRHSENMSKYFKRRDQRERAKNGQGQEEDGNAEDEEDEEEEEN